MKFLAFLTTPKGIKCVALLISLANSVLLYSDRVKAIPGLPAWVAYCWPGVYALAIVIHQAASVFGVEVPPYQPPTV